MTYSVSVEKVGCSANGPFLEGVMQSYTSGILISDSAVMSNGCGVSAKVSLNDAVTFGVVRLPVIKKTTTTTSLLGYAEVEIVPVQPEPNPPGLEPEVDVAWKILDWRNTSDSFGRKVADQYFAVDISLGNNTGYPIQLAGVFFDQNGAFNQRNRSASPRSSPIPTDPYHITRSTIERDRETGARAILMNSLSLGLGVLPPLGAFFSNMVPLAKMGETRLSPALSPRDRFSVLLGALNPFALGLGVLIPDKTIRHLIAIDTRAMRDNLLVPQNTPTRILTFLSRKSVEGAECSVYESSYPPRPNSTQVPHINCLHGRLKPVGRNGRDFNPNAVKAALGELVIIGQQIEFKNRIRITSRTVPVTPPALVVFDVVSSKKEFVQGSTTTLTVTGRGLQDLSAVASANSGVTVAIKSVDAKGVSAEIEVKVLSTAPTGPFSINFSSMEGPNPFLLSGWMVKPATAVISSTLLTTTTEVVPGNPAGNYVEFTAAENSYIANLDNATGKSCGEGCTYSLDKSKTPIKLTVVGAENAKPGERSVDLLQNNVKVATLKFQFKAATPEAKLRSGIELKCSTTPQELELIFEGKNLKWAQLINEPLAVGAEPVDIPKIDENKGNLDWTPKTATQMESVKFKVKFKKAEAGADKSYKFKFESAGLKSTEMPIVCKQ